MQLPERPSAAIETMAYFCAAELLSDVAKHSGARPATLEAVQVDALLWVRISDDGSGGARLEKRRAGWRPGAPPSIRRSLPSCWAPLDAPTRSVRLPPESATCSA